MSVEKCYNLHNYEYEMSTDVSFLPFTAIKAVHVISTCTCDKYIKLLLFMNNL